MLDFVVVRTRRVEAHKITSGKGGVRERNKGTSNGKRGNKGRMVHLKGHASDTCLCYLDIPLQLQKLVSNMYQTHTH